MKYKNIILFALAFTCLSANAEQSADYQYQQKWMPRQEVKIDVSKTAIFITDPQNSFYSKKSPIYELVHQDIVENHVVEHQQQLIALAKKMGMKVFYSPHMYTKMDYKNWDRSTFNGIDQVMFKNKMFIKGTYGYQWYKGLEPDDNTIVMNPHKGLSNFWTGDAAIQLRQYGVDTIIIAGMAANMCTESHTRDAIEHGFKVIVAEDATAAAGKLAKQAALTNFEFLANSVMTTAQVIRTVEQAAANQAATTKP